MTLQMKLLLKHIEVILMFYKKIITMLTRKRAAIQILRLLQLNKEIMVNNQATIGNSTRNQRILVPETGTIVTITGREVNYLNLPSTKRVQIKQ